MVCSHRRGNRDVKRLIDSSRFTLLVSGRALGGSVMDRTSWWVGCGGPRKVKNDPLALARAARWKAGTFLERSAREGQL